MNIYLSNWCFFFLSNCCYWNTNSSEIKYGKFLLYLGGKQSYFSPFSVRLTMDLSYMPVIVLWYKTLLSESFYIFHESFHLVSLPILYPMRSAHRYSESLHFDGESRLWICMCGASLHLREKCHLVIRRIINILVNSDFWCISLFCSATVEY
jgi:hypothetical protein